MVPAQDGEGVVHIVWGSHAVEHAGDTGSAGEYPGGFSGNWFGAFFLWEERSDGVRDPFEGVTIFCSGFFSENKKQGHEFGNVAVLPTFPGGGFVFTELLGDDLEGLIDVGAIICDSI